VQLLQSISGKEEGKKPLSPLQKRKQMNNDFPSEIKLSFRNLTVVAAAHSIEADAQL